MPNTEVRVGASSVRPTVLIVDDHSDTGEMLAEYLDFHGARALRAENVEEAREILDAMFIDVLVTDYAMPGEDGISFVRALRGTSGGATVPIVVVSGHDDRGDIATAAMQLGAHFVRKPFDLTRLVDAVQTALARATTTQRRSGEPAAARTDRETEPAPAPAPAAPPATRRGPRPRSRSTGGVVEVVVRPRSATDPRGEPES